MRRSERAWNRYGGNYVARLPNDADDAFLPRLTVSSIKFCSSVITLIKRGDRDNLRRIP